jgi:hypothetical protein
VALVFQGRKGAGKGTLGRALLNICGRHGLLIANREHLVGRFNRYLLHRLFILEDEASWAGDLKAEAVLKSMITEPWLFYEGKGLEGVPGANRVHLMKTANQDWVVPAGMDGERRYAVSRVSENIPSRATFDALYQQLDEEGGLQALMYDLQRRDISEWHPRDRVPVTRALVDQKLRSLDEVEEWWFGLLQKGRLPETEAPWNGAPVVVYKEDLQGSLLSKCQQLGASRRSMECKLGWALKRWAPGTRPIRPTVPDGSMVERDSQGRAGAYRIPPLEVCRATFERELGMELDWENRYREDREE